MLLIIYTAAVCIVLLIGLILFAAFDVIVDVKKNKHAVDRKVTIRWMGLSHTIKRIRGTTKERIDKNESGTKEKKPEKKAGIGNISSVLGIALAIVQPVLRLLSDIFRVIKIHKISGDITFGFPDPADTGIACGFLHAVHAVMNQKCNICNYSINPQFIDTIFDFHVIAKIRFRICSLVPAILRFISNRNVLGVAWTIVRKRYVPKLSTNV